MTALAAAMRGFRLDARRAAARVTAHPGALPTVGRVAAFFALSAFALLHWAALFDPMPSRRLLAVAVVATGCGAGLALSGRVPRPAGVVVRVVLLVLAAAVGLVAIGVRAKLLLPTGWGTLSDRVSGGMSVVGSVAQWPYSGPNTWLRLTALAAAPLTATLAAALAFWPLRGGEGRAGPLRFAGLALLVALYGVAAAARPFGHQNLRGAGLLLAIAAWLWLPRLRRRDALAAAVTVGVAGLVALGLTAKVASSEPWVDYRQWQWTLHKERTTVFNWRPSYGPIRWPRKGTTLLLVKSKQPHYWRAETLDRFDGIGWTESPARGQSAPRGADAMPQPGRRGWTASATVTVRGLRSQLVIGPGTPEAAPDTPERSIVLPIGTYLVDGQLKSGDTYTVRGYVPDPSAQEMHSAPPPPSSFIAYTTIDVPDRAGRVASSIQVPLRGVPGIGDRNAARALEASRYARIYRKARQLAVGASTSYEIVKNVGAYLEGSFAYSEHPPRHRYPLDAFLFEDKAGYCQQFSGAAALMLRMLGVPARVATGFAPGTLDKKTHEYVVRDLDAHSWIEVWFEGIGWVPFDPTPALAPAASQSVALGAASAARGSSLDRVPKKDLNRLLGSPEVTKVAGGGGASSDAGTSWRPIALGLAALALVGGAVAALIRRRRRVRRRLGAAACGDPDVDHLLGLLARLGLGVDPGSTLLELERRLERLGGPDAAGYARLLRERRFGSNGQAPPDRAARRHIRRVMAEALAAGRITRLQLALPDNPGSWLRALKLVRQRTP